MNQTPNDGSDIDGEVFVVGDLRVDIGQQRVTRAGAEIALPNLSFRLFVALIRAAPNVLSQDTLMERVWPGLVVSPETLTKRANLLREALGDDAKEPRYVSAVRSRGYRLVADVARIERTAPMPAISAPVLAAGKPDIGSSVRAPRWLRISAFMIVAIAAGFFARTLIMEHGTGAIVPAENPVSTDAPIVTRARTVAVLPFENISADATDAYLAKGLPEMVLDRLSRVSGLAVIARNSSFALNTTSIDSQEIGRRLNSGYLVSGSVQRRADRLRVAVQLVDTTAGTLIWSANFDRTLSDIFRVEDEIAEQVTSALAERVGGLEPTPATQVRSSNVQAYLAYLRGRTLLGRFSVAESESAVPYFEKAIAMDPNFAAAYASLYDARLQIARLQGEDIAPVRQHYQPLIERALAIDPDSGAAYFARAMWASTPFEARNADFLKGIALDPSNGRGLTAYAEFLDYEDLGWMQANISDINYPVRREEAKRILRRALRIDPMSPGARFDAVTGGLDGGDFASLERGMISVLELDPDFVPALVQVGKYRWMFHGKLTEAVQILEHAIALDPRNPEPRDLAMGLYLDLGDEQAARAVAAGPTQSTQRLRLLFIYKGDWRAAGRTAFDAGPDANCGFWMVNQAVRDYALKTGQLNQSMAFIETHNYFEGDPATHLDDCNSEGAVVLAQLLAAQGHASQAQALRRVAMSVFNAKNVDVTRRKLAEILMLDGHRDEALDALAEDFRSGHYTFWWYTLKLDPVWVPLHGDPRFQAIAKDVQRYVGEQRRELDELRRLGNVPDARRGM